MIEAIRLIGQVPLIDHDDIVEMTDPDRQERVENNLYTTRDRSRDLIGNGNLWDRRPTYYFPPGSPPPKRSYFLRFSSHSLPQFCHQFQILIALTQRIRIIGRILLFGEVRLTQQRFAFVERKTPNQIKHQYVRAPSSERSRHPAQEDPPPASKGPQWRTICQRGEELHHIKKGIPPERLINSKSISREGPSPAGKDLLPAKIHPLVTGRGQIHYQQEKICPVQHQRERESPPLAREGKSTNRRRSTSKGRSISRRGSTNENESSLKNTPRCTSTQLVKTSLDDLQSRRAYVSSNIQIYQAGLKSDSGTHRLGRLGRLWEWKNDPLCLPQSHKSF